MLTPEERRGALLILGLVLLGAAWDAGLALRKETPPPDVPAAVAVSDPDPSRAEGPVGAVPLPAPADSAGRAGAAPILDLNRAGPAELDALPGIGPVLARRIVEHRSRNGAFRSLEELRAVRGIGPSLIGRLRGHVRFGS